MKSPGRTLVLGLAAAGLVACGRADDGDGDDDRGDAATTDGSAADAPTADAPTVDARPLDARPLDARPLDAAIDAVPPTSDNHIHLMVSNTCQMTVSPTTITVPPDQTAYFRWHNHSADYPVTVWLSYGGGYTDLPMGQTWNEPVGHCGTPLVHDEYADISTACSSFRFIIHCQ